MAGYNFRMLWMKKQILFAALLMIGIWNPSFADSDSWAQYKKTPKQMKEYLETGVADNAYPSRMLKALEKADSKDQIFANFDWGKSLQEKPFTVIHKAQSQETFVEQYPLAGSLYLPKARYQNISPHYDSKTKKLTVLTRVEDRESQKSTAYHLAEVHGKRVRVTESLQMKKKNGWGNDGQARYSTSITADLSADFQNLKISYLNGSDKVVTVIENPRKEQDGLIVDYQMDWKGQLRLIVLGADGKSYSYSYALEKLQLLPIKNGKPDMAPNALEQMKLAATVESGRSHKNLYRKQRTRGEGAQ